MQLYQKKLDQTFQNLISLSFFNVTSGQVYGVLQDGHVFFGVVKFPRFWQNFKFSKRAKLICSLLIYLKSF